MEEALWSPIEDEIIEEYSTLFNGNQIGIAVLAGLLFAIIFIIFGAIFIFDKLTRSPPPTHYSIKFDAKGFSSNDLRLYNCKSVDGGCRLNSVMRVPKGDVRIMKANKLFVAPGPRLDVLLQPWIGGNPTSLAIIEWCDFVENAGEQADAIEEGGGTAEVVRPPPPPIVTTAAQPKSEKVVQNDKPAAGSNENKKNANTSQKQLPLPQQPQTQPLSLKPIKSSNENAIEKTERNEVSNHAAQDSKKFKSKEFIGVAPPPTTSPTTTQQTFQTQMTAFDAESPKDSPLSNLKLSRKSAASVKSIK